MYDCMYKESPKNVKDNVKPKKTKNEPNSIR